MSRVLTNDITIAYAVEEPDGDFGELPTSPAWKQLEPNDISKWGAEIKTVSRNPISKNRQVRKGTIVDLDSNVELKCDLTMDSFVDFIEGFCFAQAVGFSARVDSVIASGDKFNMVDGYTLPADVVAGKLVYTRGFTHPGNNGLNVITSVNAGTAASKVFTLTSGNASDGDTVTIGTTVYRFETTPSQAYDVKISAVDNDGSVANLVAAINGSGTPGTEYFAGTIAHPDVTAGVETGDGTTTVTAKLVGTAGNAIALAESGANSSWAGGAVFLSGGVLPYIAATGATTVDETVAATQLATIDLAGVRSATGDLDVNSDGNITSTVLDFTALNLTLGQFIYVGAGVGASNSFGTTANNGFARVMGIAANLLTLDKKLTTYVTESNTTHAVDLYWGRFVRNVVVDDDDYINRRFQFEATFPELFGFEAPGYEYSLGNFCDQVSFELPLANKALATFGFIGTDTEPPVDEGDRKTNAEDAKQPQMTTAFNTTSDVARLRVANTDESGLTTDFKTITLKLNNNVSPEKVIGVLGARFMNNGIFEVDMDTKCLFTDGDVLSAIRNNTTVSMDFALVNDDGGMVVDIPAMTLGDGAKDFPAFATVTIALKGKAFIDPTLGTSLGVSIFPYLPA